MSSLPIDRLLLAGATPAPTAGTNPVDGTYHPILPGGQVGSSVTTIINWSMGGALIAIALGILFCLALSAFGSATSRPDVASRGKAGVPIGLVCAAGVGVLWPLVSLFSGLGGGS